MAEKVAAFVVPETDALKRADVFLTANLAGVSRSFLKRLFGEGSISVNGKAVKASHTLQAGDEIKVCLPEAAPLDVLPEDIPLDILYEDDDILVVNKPKGMVVHPAAGHTAGTLVNAVLFHCKDSLSGINGVLRPGIVHRIDKDTTGSVLICKNDAAHAAIAAQLQAHSLERVYHAVCHGMIEEDTLTIDAPIGRSTRDRKKMAVIGGAKGQGKEAVTHVSVLERFYEDNLTYVACRLETGRTHQIRVHLSHRFHPILGDTVYGAGRNTAKRIGEIERRMGGEKILEQCLHAKELSFTHPVTNERIHTDAPLPAYFTALLQALRGRDNTHVSCDGNDV